MTDKADCDELGVSTRQLGLVKVLLFAALSNHKICDYLWSQMTGML